MFEMSPYSNNYLYFGNNIVQYPSQNLHSNKNLTHSKSEIYKKKSPINNQKNTSLNIQRFPNSLIKPKTNLFFQHSKDIYKSSVNMNIQSFLEKYNIQKDEMENIKRKNSEILKLQDSVIESKKEFESLNSDREDLKKKIKALEDILKEKDEIIEIYQQKDEKNR